MSQHFSRNNVRTPKICLSSQIFSCIDGCVCQGLSIDCTKRQSNSTGTDKESILVSPGARFIDLSYNPEIFKRIYQINQSLIYLIFLDISFCEIPEIKPSFLETMRNLRFLDISFNKMRSITSNLFVKQDRLTTLKLEGNLNLLAIEQQAFAGLSSMLKFSMVHLEISNIANNAFDSLNLTILSFSSNTIHKIQNDAFRNLKTKALYFNWSSIISFDEGMFDGLENVETLVTNAFKFCCIRPSTLPEESCYPHKDEFSSCTDLMRNLALRSLIWIIGFFALIGNSVVFIYRVTKDRERLNLGYGIFVTNLAVSDFMMGMYLIIIASADAHYRDVYIYNDDAWKSSTLCQFAGVLSAISSESAVLFIVLITVDRILVIKFPFGQVKFTKTKSWIAGICVWVFSVIIAIVPVAYKPYFKGLFYSKTGICLALPLTRDRPPGWVYSIGIFIGFNFITFVCIAVGQWLIYWEVKRQKKKIAKAKTDRSNDLRISRNLLMVVATDFLCWFPVGIIGTFFVISLTVCTHTCIHRSLVTRKPVFGVCDQVRHKLACAATEAR